MWMRVKRGPLSTLCLVTASAWLLSGCLGSEDGKGTDNGCGFIEELVFGCDQDYSADTGWNPYWDTGYDAASE
ncbi:MAG: hypothetical protein CL930_10925 [Deltaproteobacteria bacterium]|jgi:hypothetical protein|nr:hypothetical protein [Deltaproteobacteria bacterium]MAY81281.1 hypothetical protein [Deltaproteobacteria bacterium]